MVEDVDRDLLLRPEVRGLTVDEIADAHYVYPSFSEGLEEAAQLAPRFKAPVRSA
jgi:hypothetical protein